MNFDKEKENMMEHEIPLNQIEPAPWNPPERIAPENVRGLADSIKLHGQKQTALVRPVNEHYEVVFGHRRYGAMKLLAEEEPETYATLKCKIEELTDAQALILSGVENLQREDFTDFEEAVFLLEVSKLGEDHIRETAEKLSLSQPYVRKRLTVLTLPTSVLELWRDGTWTLSHLTQLLRLGDQVEEWLEEYRDELDELTVADLRDLIDREAIPLHAGRFSKDDCKFCSKNSDYQHQLFELPRDSKCLDEKCFITKQTAWLDAHWKDNNEYGTNQAIMGNYSEVTGSFGWEADPGQKCQDCPQFTTILDIRRVMRERACMGEKSCYLSMKKKDTLTPGEKRKVDPNAPRVPWHGEFFRQEFYQAELPNLVFSLPQDDPRRLQVALANAVISSNHGCQEWFASIYGIDSESPYYFSIRFSAVLDMVRGLDKDTVEHLLSEVILRTTFEAKEARYIFTDEDRQALAQFFDIDFANFEVTEDYLKKKTKAELVQFITKDSGLFLDHDFLRYCKNHGWTDAEKLAGLKKSNLISLILLKKGWDLKGRLPSEIRLEVADVVD